MKKINIVIPIYNEEAALPFLKNRLINIMKKEQKYSYEVVLIDDGSSDNSSKILKQISKKDSRFTYISLSRNFGKEIALCAGLDYSINADATIIMDADLQDPPELIPKLIKEWEKGYDDVYAKRKSRDGETILKKITSKMYYYVLQKFTNIPIQKDTGDFRLLDQKCVQAICSLRENSRCSKSLFSYIGYNKKEVLFNRDKRIAGKTKWNYKKLVNLAIDGITSLSTSPLRWSAYIGILLFIMANMYIIYNITIINENKLIIYLVLFLSSIQFLLIAIIGEYIGKIFNETKNRPLYLIKEVNSKNTNFMENKNEYKEKTNSNYISNNNINTNYQ